MSGHHLRSQLIDSNALEIERPSCHFKGSYLIFVLLFSSLGARGTPEGLHVSSMLVPGTLNDIHMCGLFVIIKRRL
jgi:Na+/H+-dicarboxylate symporter